MKKMTRPMQKIILPFFAIGLGLVSSCETAPDGAAGAQNQFSSESLHRHVEILASDQFEGRGAGYPGEDMAATYIAKQFEAIGLQPIQPGQTGWRGFLQAFDMQSLDGPIPWEIRQSQNVVGILPGDHPDGEYIVIGGHYDGQGKVGQADLGRNISEGDADYVVAKGDIIWNSAVDNAVSIASLIEIAHNLSRSTSSQRRTIVFIAFGAEESALDGSAYYVNNPIARLGPATAMINLEKLVGDPGADFLYVSYGTSDVFPIVTQRTVAATGVNLVPFYPGVIANTDHYAFILSGIPAITIGTGSVDNVHTPSDHADGLDYELLAKRTRFISTYLTHLSGIENRFEFSGDTKGRYGASGGPATKEERLLRNVERDHTFKIATVINGSPADKAGLKPGDLIVEVNGAPVPQQEFYQGLEDLFEEDVLCNKVELSVKRGDQNLTITLPPNC